MWLCDIEKCRDWRGEFPRSLMARSGTDSTEGRSDGVVCTLGNAQGESSRIISGCG
jgi:hypothetical protein